MCQCRGLEKDFFISSAMLTQRTIVRKISQAGGLLGVNPSTIYQKLLGWQ
ncbi:hypothetical protein [Candidatus Enterovibrio escicola]